MKVLYITHNFPRSAGDAAGSFVLRLAVALRDEGIEVRVIAPTDDALPSSDVFDGITVERFRYAPRRFENLAYHGNMATQVQESWSARLALLGFLGSEFANAVRVRRNFEPDLVHAHWWFPGGLVGTWVSGLSRVPLITTLHGTDVRLARGTPMARPLFRRVMQQSHTVTAVSRFLATEASTIVSGVSPVVAPMPVAAELFQPGSGSRESSRLLFVGRLNQQKGIERLLEALARTRTNASLDVIGDGTARAEFEARANALGVAPRVRWIGAMKQHELVPHYQNAAALVVPSTDEGLGLVAVEALLCRTPVIAFESGGLTDIVQHERSGLLVPAGDVDALAAAIDAIVAAPETAATYGEAGRMIALSRFAPESVARRYAGIYRDAVGQRTT
jgi:glycosyltransferase involved in cell wall biosynthesis